MDSPHGTTQEIQQSSKCSICGEREIAHQMRKMCRTCYNRLNRNKKLEKLSSLENFREEKRRKIIEKYGDSIGRDLESLKNNPYFNTGELTRKYGISREYSRQLFERWHGESYSIALKEKKKKGKEEKKLLGVCDWHPVFKENNSIHKTTIFKFLSKCRELGIRVCQAGSRDFPSTFILNNNLLVRVKGCRKTHSIGKYIFYRFQVEPKSRLFNELDFLICFCENLNKFYIIPTKVCKNSSIIYISENTIKWKKYENRWDLLFPNYDKEVTNG